MALTTRGSMNVLGLFRFNETSTMATLPTLDKLGLISLPDEIESQAIAADWIETFARYAKARDVGGILDTLTEDAFFRDMLVLTWDFRTFQGIAQIKEFLHERFTSVNFEEGSFKLKSVDLQRPYGDISWILGTFCFHPDIPGY